MKYDCVVFIGRFQPFHLGHKKVVEQALTFSNQVLLLIGSANRPRSLKNPFNFDERCAMIEAACTDLTAANQQIHCLPIDDTPYNDHLWLQNIQKAIMSQTQPDDNIAIIGHDKDDSSYYLKLFVNWAFIRLPSYFELSATPIRLAYFNPSELEIDGFLQDRLPSAVVNFLKNFESSAAYHYLVQQYQDIQATKQSYQSQPYPPIFQTADVLLVQAGHIAVIRRGGRYGQGLLALAGGFVDAGETVLAAAQREAAEEMGIDICHLVPDRVRTFDDPNRSERGRTITTVFVYELTGDVLPSLKAGDDASEAFWLPLGQLDGRLFFEDHYGIVGVMLGVY